ncbi:transcription factor A, mitochondrial [Caerostris darwini]|uniref:Transcription factor A, mitochondrial n=1 Tax=Caerostris darwini TaxID=1538125 RepID=A0AAV4Q9N8_9ARAC|nr:transcription factor A, mitochondrial [Caerostris darwini]
MAFLRGTLKSCESIIFRNCSVPIKNNYPVSTKKALDIPLPPKKPLTAYMIFCQDKRKELLQKSPSLNITEQIKILASQWNQLSLPMREPFQERARKCTVLYGEAHKKYFESLSEEQKQKVASLKAEKRESRRLFRIKKALKESAVPKSPASAYALFVKSESKEKVIKNLSEVIKEIADKWKTLPETEKKKWEKTAQDDKHRFSSELEKWKKQMVADGKEGLIEKYEEMKRGKSLDIEEIPKKPKEKTKAKSKQA